MAWFAVPEAVLAHFAFKRSRTDKVNNGLRNFANFTCSLVGNRWGWLHQQPELIRTLPESAVRGRSWEELCLQTYRLATNLSGKFDGLSRDPKDAIASILEDPKPLAKMERVVRALDAVADRYPIGSRFRSTAKRDALIIALLCALPIRSENLASLRVTNNADFGFISPMDNKQYLLRALVTKTRGTSSGGEYNGVTDVDLSSRIDDYLQVHRPILLRGRESDLLFVSSHNPTQIWRTINNQVYEVTKRHLPDSPGFGPHSFRHIVCTAFLEAHPDQELVAAMLLGITVETLRKYYYKPNEKRAMLVHAQDLEAARREAKRREEAENGASHPRPLASRDGGRTGEGS